MSDPVLVAVITSIASPIVVGLLARRGAKRTADALTETLDAKVGTPNGKGNVVQMLERLLNGQTGQDSRIAVLETHDLDHEFRIRAIEARQKETP